MPVLDLKSFEFISRSAEQTRRLGMRLGSMLEAGDVVGLVGDLGAGKTTLVQGISAGWGSLDPASSPTFVLVNVYRRPEGAQLFHLDAYRLSGPKEAEDLDLDTLIDSGPLVIEWADRIEETLPKERLWVSLRWIDTDQRDLVITAAGARYTAMLSELRERLYGVF
jgi:tRNA threonylcarbamoyladenosine biosynthesis protein TsaE